MTKIPIKLQDKVLHAFLRAGRKFLPSRLDIIDLDKVNAFVVEKDLYKTERYPSVQVKTELNNDAVFFLSPERFLIKNNKKDYDILIEITK